jgi:hypothetical protein
MNARYRWAIVALLAASAHAAEQGGLRFEHGEWELACDNTRTCRAAGYHEEQDGALPVSVLLTRKAGPATPVVAELQLGGANNEDFVPKGAASLPLTMRIDGKPLGRVVLTRKDTIPALSPDQTRALLAALNKTSTIEWSDGKRTWRLSGSGAAAVMLKMDDFQGRIGTPGALVRKGGKDENSVLPALPAPVVRAVPVPAPDKSEVTLPKAAVTTLRAALLATLKEGECDIFSDPEREREAEPESIKLDRLSPTRLLASTVCWRGAYNEGTGYWVVHSTAPFAPQLVTLDASDYGDGTIRAGQKGRGIGDCWSSREWTWDGARFVQTEDGTSGLCKQIAAGGAWSLPTLVSEVRRAR